MGYSVFLRGDAMQRWLRGDLSEDDATSIFERDVLGQARVRAQVQLSVSIHFSPGRFLKTQWDQPDAFVHHYSSPTHALWLEPDTLCTYCPGRLA